MKIEDLGTADKTYPSFGNTIFNALIISFLLLCFSLAVNAETFPAGPESSRVWDVANVLSSEQIEKLESLTQSYRESLEAPVWIVICKDLQEYESFSDINSYAEAFLNTELTDGGENRSALIIVASEPKSDDETCHLELGRGWNRADVFDARAMTKSVYLAHRGKRRSTEYSLALGLMEGLTGLADQ